MPAVALADAPVPVVPDAAPPAPALADARVHVVPGAAPPAPATASGPAGVSDRLIITLAGVRQPIVAILILIALFAKLSGKPLDGVLLIMAAAALASEAGLRSRNPAATSTPGPAWRPASRRTSWRLLAGGVTAAGLYAAVIGSFTRYSWPATAGVASLGVVVVLIGWGGPVRQRADPGPMSRAGAITWAGIGLAGCLWELAALVSQPSIETSSWAHPTISTLTDPLLGSGTGRAVALLAWIGFGWFLVQR